MTDLCQNSCCILYKKTINADGQVLRKIRGQGIVFLRCLRNGQKKYALLTCHHLITSRKDAVGFYVIGKRECIGFFSLNEDNVGSCYSCCGENGILGKNQHPKEQNKIKSCPFDLDFTLMELKGSAEKILSAIELPDLELSMEASEALMDGLIMNDPEYPLINPPQQCCFYQRSEFKNPNTGKRDTEVLCKEHYLNLPLFPPASLKVDSVKDWSYNVVFCLKVLVGVQDVCGEGSSGAPIYATHESEMPLLIGMHTGIDVYEVDHRNKIVSTNTNFLWIIQLLKVELGCIDLYELSCHVLWAIFLQYEEKEPEIKNDSLLSKVAVVIWKQLYRSPEQVQLREEEQKVFEKINNFCKS